MSPYVLGGAIAAGIFGAGTVSRFEHEAAAELSSNLQGQNRKVAVRANVGIESIFGTVPSVTISASDFTSNALPFHTEPNRSKHGILKRLNLDLTNFTLSGLQVQSLQATIPNCRFDMALAMAHHRFRLSKSGTGQVTVTVRDQSFEPFILTKYKEVKSVTVRMDHDEAHISGFVQLGFLATTFHVDSHLAAKNKVQLVFIDPQVSLANGKPDPKLASLLLSLFDPILDLDKDLHLEGAVNVDHIELKDGLLIGHGSVIIPNLSTISASNPPIPSSSPTTGSPATSSPASLPKSTSVVSGGSS
jgi:hypothetical protein